MLALLAVLAIDAAILAKLESPYSGEREKAVYALGRLHDAQSYDDRARIDQAVIGGASGQLRAAALRGLCDRSWRDGLSMTAAELVTRSLEDRDPAAVSAAAECAERMERSRAVKLLANELDSRRGEAYVLPLLSTAGRMGESSLQELAVGAADRLGIRLGTELVLDAKRSRALLALAALGADVEASLPEAKKPDFFRDARTNAIRAASGDAVALAKLVETANVAADLHLRREAVDLALLLPPEPRLGALRGLASRVTEPDGGVRGRMVRELSRAAGSADAWIEPLLVKAAADPFPDVRLHALCGLLDRGALSAEVRASLPAKDSDPFANAALRAIPIATPTPSPSPEPSPSPAPIASPSPVPSASSAPVPSRTPYRWGR